MRWIRRTAAAFSLCIAGSSALVLAQPAPAPEAPAAAPAAEPAAAPPGAPTAETPVPAAEPAPAPAPMAAPAAPPAIEAPAAEPPPPPPPAEDVTKKPIDVHAWGHLGSRLQGAKEPKKLNHLTTNGDLELHTDGQITQEIGFTANIVGSYGPIAGAGGTASPNGSVAILDAIGRFDIADPFHVWAGRMLVPSDRANFSGVWFEAPWYYPGTFSSNGFIGPHEGPNGRNDGATIWGQAEGGLFKYYVGAFDLYDSTKRPLWTARLNLSLLNPEPGYYHSSTYYGKDILAIGVGAQMQSHGSLAPTPTTGTAPSPANYKELNADVLFEKNLNGSGVIDLEGAFYDYGGSYEPFKYSYLGLISYLTADKVGPGKIQPLVRLQQAKVRATDGTDTSIEAQIGYVIAEYSARLALGYQYTKVTGALSDTKGNAIYLGAQLLK